MFRKNVPVEHMQMYSSLLFSKVYNINIVLC